MVWDELSGTAVQRGHDRDAGSARRNNCPMASHASMPRLGFQHTHCRPHLAPLDPILPAFSSRVRKRIGALLRR